jgi:hypothetical protein
LSFWDLNDDGLRIDEEIEFANVGGAESSASLILM